MKFFKLLAFVILTTMVSTTFAQKKGSNFNLKNAVIVGQFDKQEDRYSLEATITQMFTGAGIKAMPSLNLVKVGEDAARLAGDSLQTIAKEKGFDTYIIVYVRGYDKKFKPSTTPLTFKEALERGSLYSIYELDIVSVTFEFRVYRNGEFVGVDTIKCGGGDGRDSVLRKLRKQIDKRLKKSWR